MTDMNPVSTPPGLIDRAKSILIKPKSEWEVIDAEPASIGSIFIGYFFNLGIGGCFGSSGSVGKRFVVSGNLSGYVFVFSNLSCCRICCGFICCGFICCKFVCGCFFCGNLVCRCFVGYGFFCCGFISSSFICRKFFCGGSVSG